MNKEGRFYKLPKQKDPDLTRIFSSVSYSIIHLEVRQQEYKLYHWN